MFLYSRALCLPLSTLRAFSVASLTKVNLPPQSSALIIWQYIFYGVPEISSHAFRNLIRMLPPFDAGLPYLQPAFDPDYICIQSKLPPVLIFHVAKCTLYAAIFLPPSRHLKFLYVT
ncbi:hypothetical protein B0H16DRAFT_1884748 [Mycena metata]|uniref:Secreted protein n=1 Tax=Mycena metata TaxID=1033252 RepID=A0AAD7JC26_9AGAR|nr:hypothetical protein B0H16DRAFT_1884748 [Mycena metata]